MLSSSFPRGGIPTNLLSLPILDLRSGSPRYLLNGGGSLGSGNQDYFPLGPLSTVLTASVSVPQYSLDHQSQAIHGNVESSSKTVNSVGIWGSAKSNAAGARIWGSFFDVTNSPAQDAQMVGEEVDVTNYASPGTSPHSSKDGIQIVGLGKSVNTNGIEILASDNGYWENGILFSNNSISKDGALIGSSIPGTVSRGIDFSNTHFSDSAIKLSPGSQIVWSNPDLTSSGIFLGDGRYGDKGIMTIRAGSAGFRITDVTGQKTLLSINGKGQISPATFNVSETHANNNSLIITVLISLISSILTMSVLASIIYRRLKKHLGVN